MKLAALMLAIAGGAALGLLDLVAVPPGRWREWARGMIVGVLLAAAAGFAAAGARPQVWFLPAVVAAADILLLTVRRLAGPLARTARFMLHARRLAAATLLAVPPVVAFGWGWHIDRSDETPMFQESPDAPPNEELGLRPGDRSAQTDRGRPVVLYVYKPKGPIEERFRPELQRRLIRTAPSDLAANCHGWVFTGGRYCLQGRQVEDILSDNGYVPVSEPRPKDIIIYRDRSGQILHTGLVRAADRDLILIESKWGTGGRFLHAPADQDFSPTWTYYRSPRPGHLLTGDWAGP